MAVGKIKYIMATGLVVALSVVAFFHEREASREAFMMDTIVTIRAFHRSDDTAAGAIGQTLRDMQSVSDTLDRHLSPSISEVARINSMAGQDPVAVTGDTLSVLDVSLQVAQTTSGAFDPTVGALVDLWEQAREHNRLPTAGQLQTALDQVDYNGLILDRDASTASLARPELVLDLGGSAKGHVVDVAASSLRNQGITRAFIDAGGDIAVLGRRDRRNPWRIGIADPLNPSQVLGIVTVEDETIVTSGTYQRFSQVADGEFHHIVSPFSGYPTEGILSATVMGPSALLGDALSTALMVLGPREGIRIIHDHYPDYRALIVTEERTLHLSAGMREVFTLTKYEVYRYAE